MDLLKILLLASLFSIIFGQIVRIPIGVNQAITITDIFVFATIGFFLMHSLLIKKSLIIHKQLFIPFLLFTLIACLSTFFSFNNFSTINVGISSLFLIRFIIYFFISILVFNTVKKEEIIHWLKLSLLFGLIFQVIGIIQFFLLPDLTFLADFGWDPHQKRLVSTFLDPNFSGGLILFFLTYSLCLYLYERKKMYLTLSLIALVSIILTFSRSSYVALAVAFCTIGILKSPKVILLGVSIFILTYSISAKFRDRTIGAVTLDETAKARFESWNNAIDIFKKNYLIGVGFNTYRLAQADYGIFSQDQPEGGHSGAGSDSSTLLVAATTGLLGITLFIFFIASIGKIALINSRHSGNNLAFLASFSGIVIHSQFVNSFFFPQIMLYLWFYLGLILKDDS